MGYGLMFELQDNNQAVTKAQTTPDKYIASTFQLIEGFGALGAKPWPFDYRRAVEQCRGWVYRCAMGNAMAAASVPLRLYVRKLSDRKLKARGLKVGCVWRTRSVPASRRCFLLGEHYDRRPSSAVCTKLMEFGDDFEEVTDVHPVLEVLRRVSPHHNSFNLAVFRFLSLELTGNAYHHPVMDEQLDRPRQLWPMMPQWTWIQPGGVDTGRFVDGYVYGRTSLEAQEFSTDEVLHFRYPSLVDTLYGFGKVEASWQSIGIDVSKEVMDKALFDNNARPDYLLVNETAQQDQVDRMKTKVKGLLRGVHKSGDFLALAGKWVATPLSFPPGDIGSDERVVEKIAGVFGYPVTKLKANDPNRANAESGDAGWMKDTINPMLRQDEEALNQDGYLGLFNSGALLEDAVLAYDDPVPANRKMELAESRTLVAMGGKTLNEDRADRGLPPYASDIGDVPRVNGQSVLLMDEQARSTAEGPTNPLAGLFPVRAEPEPSPINVDESLLERAMEFASVQSQVIEKLASVVGRLEELERKPTPVELDEPEAKVPEKYSHIDFKPSKSAANEAQRGLDWRSEFGRGGTEVGIARARDIANRRNLSPETVKRMKAFFDRHESDKEGEGFRPGEDGFPSNGRIAWALWGGDPGRSWANARVAQMETADERANGKRFVKADQDAVSHKAIMAGETVCGCGAHSKAETGAAEDNVRQDEPESPLVRLTQRLREIFDRQARAVIEALGVPTGKAAPRRKATPDEIALAIAALEKQTGVMADSLREVIDEMLSIGAESGLRSLGLDVTFDVTNPSVAEAMRNYALRLAGEVNQTSITRLQSALSEGLEAGETIRQLADRVQNTFSDFSRSRAETIARTESARSFVEGEQIGWRESGVVQGKQWLLAPNPCEFCAAVAQQFEDKVVGLNDPFFTQGTVIEGIAGGKMKLDFTDVTGPPLHPRCRCDVIPVLFDG